MQISHNALVLVADGQRHRFLRNQGTFAAPKLVVEGQGEHISAPTHRLGTDEPGRSFASVGPRRSAVEQTDFHQLEKDRFAARVAEMINRRAKGGEFDELIVVAPPQTLAELRRNYDREVKARLVGEVSKDLTKHDVEQVASILGEA